jgi:hypothetical protein
MKSMKDAAGRLTWKRSTDNRSELHDGDALVGTITLGDNEGTGETADGKWSFHKHGFLNPHVLVRDAKTRKQVGRFEATMTGGGVLILIDGRNFRVAGNTWKAEWRWLATTEDELVTFKYSGFAVDGSPEGTVEIHDKGQETAHLPMLVVLGCYLIHLIAESEFK